MMLSTGYCLADEPVRQQEMSRKFSLTIARALCTVWLVACIAPPQPQAVSLSTAAPSSLPPMAASPTPQSSQQADLRIDIDVTDVQGAVNALAGIQGGPLQITHGDADLSEWYRQGAIDHVRLPQGTIPNNLTLGGIFPDEFAPIDEPASYQFQRIDRYMQAIINAGATPLWQATYDIGSSDSLSEDGLQLGRLPSDPQRWAAAIRQTLLHFNDGWAEGHRWQVRYVEFINQPFELGGCQSDEGGIAECWQMFKTFASAVNDYNAQTGRNVKIIGPGITLSANAEELESQLATLAMLLDVLEPDELDYLSFQSVGRTPLERQAVAQEVRSFLDGYADGSFSHAGLWASQWRSTADLSPDRDEQVRVAALDTATKILWQDSVDFATLYRADRWPQGPAESADLLSGEVDCDEATACIESLYFTAEGEPLPAFLPFLALAEMANDTPQRVAISHSQQHLTPVLAARSPDAAHFSVLVAAPQNTSRTYSITLRGLPPGVSYFAERFTIDVVAQEWVPRQSVSVTADNSGTISLAGQIAGPAVVYLRLRALH